MTSEDAMCRAKDAPIAWNALTSPWMDVLTANGEASKISPLEALSTARSIHRITSANPLDVFAAHRFLVTVVYWVAGDVLAVTQCRESMLHGEVPRHLMGSLTDLSGHFNLFDDKAPFLQDPSVAEAKRSSAAYLFAEMASGTNVAHFHHGRDDASRLCLRCATQGLLRVVPWMQSGGAGLSPAIHGAPPIMPLAIGDTLCETLGLNLIPIDAPFGKPQWTGQFRPTSSQVPLLEGLTWNARRIHLLEPSKPARCSRCGDTSQPTVGPVVFEKNDACKKDPKRTWRDPSAFYSMKNGSLFATVKSGKESIAAAGDDIRNLFERKFGKKIEPAPSSLVVEANPDHKRWYVTVPCTNPANNKSFDHRAVWIDSFEAPQPPQEPCWPKDVPIRVGSREFRCKPVKPSRGALALVAAAASLTSADWAVLGGARSMEDDPAAFDVFTGIYWPLRTKHASLPCRSATWLALKLMAAAGKLRPPGERAPDRLFRPWTEIELHQPKSASGDRYPLSIPSGDRLETTLRSIIGRHCMSSSPAPIDWPGTCQFLDVALS